MESKSLNCEPMAGPRTRTIRLRLVNPDAQDRLHAVVAAAERLAERLRLCGLTLGDERALLDALDRLEA